mgnify:CR=1 FL=1
MGRLFGTDGARGVAITELTCETAMLIGRAAALVLTNETDKKPRIFIGKDTRISSDVLEAALCAGICSVGADAVRLGVVPTPAVAYLVRTKGADAGVMISASHNSVEFNGIKLFASTGYKLPDSVEEEIEKLVLDSPEDMPLRSNTEIGRITDYEAAQDDYIDYIANCIDSNLNGTYLALDCANGSASSTAKKLFEKLGARVDMLSADPDGTNINDNCGSTHMEHLMIYVKEHGCDAGLAFDGDADRCLAVDENGCLVDGDKLIAIAANAMKNNGKLKNNTAVVTVMSNLGFFHFAKREGIETAATKVGDRYVLEEMLANGYNIGGEQSGHIIFLDHSTTGDGQLSGAKIIEIIVNSGKKMSEVASVMESFPQIMLNVRIKPEHRNVWRDDENVKSVMSLYEEKLGEDGRILVRESGTEPLIRVMVEGNDAVLMEEACRNITAAIEEFVQK